jgi:hypothetical protein
MDLFSNVDSGLRIAPDYRSFNRSIRSLAETVQILKPQTKAKIPMIGRNDPCPCGSGKKFKKCCLGKAESVVVGRGAKGASSELRQVLEGQMICQWSWADPGPLSTG